MDSEGLEAKLGGQSQQRTPLQVLVDIEGPGSTFQQDATDYFCLAQLTSQVRTFCCSCSNNTDISLNDEAIGRKSLFIFASLSSLMTPSGFSREAWAGLKTYCAKVSCLVSPLSVSIVPPWVSLHTCFMHQHFVHGVHAADASLSFTLLHCLMC